MSCGGVCSTTHTLTCCHHGPLPRRLGARCRHSREGCPSNWRRDEALDGAGGTAGGTGITASLHASCLDLRLTSRKHKCGKGITCTFLTVLKVAVGTTNSGGRRIGLRPLVCGKQRLPERVRVDFVVACSDVGRLAAETIRRSRWEKSRARVALPEDRPSIPFSEHETRDQAQTEK